MAAEVPTDAVSTDGTPTDAVASITVSSDAVSSKTVSGGTGAVNSAPIDRAPAQDPAATTSERPAADDADSGDAAARATTSPAASTGRPARGGGARPKRPVDVFFDGAPVSPGDDEDRPADRGNAAGSGGGSQTSRGRGGRRSVSAEAMEHALARGSRGGRTLGARSDSAASGGDGPQELDARIDDAPLSTPVDKSGETTRDDEDQVSRETLVEVPGAVFAEIPVVEIQPNSRQPRSVFDEDEMAELVHSIRTIGVLQPIVVRRRALGGGYELVMGERRWRATQRAGLETIPAIVRSTDDTDMLRDALLENLHRSQLNPLEEAAAYQQLLDDFAATHDELASSIGRSRPQISNTLRLLQLPPLVQRRVAAGVLSAGHARALLSLADAGEIEKLAQRIVSEGMSVRATEEAVALSDGLKRSPRNPSARNTVRHERLDYLANSLSDYLDTSVKVSLGARKGKVSIEFGSVEDLNRIIDLISPDARQ
ncbi:ParB/RepB/Spo0J family partition protein [Tersicoccus solisilvae]|uniref:ParB/RepB/Spo0J family partition protein n=1 Tax=Tersicoccus solisilvae TaxID=1882339 RepID=UPI001E64BAD0|nr:ParB/RepB/Spo0J family partition protein [Tersicoccus solisilvae]